MGYVKENISIENATIMYKNFSGKPDPKFNRNGKRHFTVAIDDFDAAKRFMEDGWNIKEVRNEDEEIIGYRLQVTVQYSEYSAPTVLIKKRTGVEYLNEDTVGLVDNMDIRTADVVIRPYNWEVNGKTGVAAYLKAIYLTLDEDEFAHKYEMPTLSDVPF